MRWRSRWGLDVSEGTITVHRGKGRKSRRVGLASGAGAALVAWLNMLDDDATAIFRPMNKGGRILERRWSTRAVGRARDRLGEVAGVQPLHPSRPQTILRW